MAFAVAGCQRLPEARVPAGCRALTGSNVRIRGICVLKPGYHPGIGASRGAGIGGHMDQEVLFGQRAYTDPWGTLRELQQADMRRPSAGRKARMAALHAVVGDLVESVMLAGAVVEASEPVAPLERARAHVSLAASWAAAGGLNVAVRGMTPRQHIAAGLRILAEADPGGGYLTAASLINAATAEYTIGDLDAAYRHLGRARGLVSSWGKSAPMRGPYLGLIEFNTVVMADLDERGMVAALLGVHDQARREESCARAAWWTSIWPGVSPRPISTRPLSSTASGPGRSGRGAGGRSGWPASTTPCWRSTRIWAPRRSGGAWSGS